LIHRIKNVLHTAQAGHLADFSTITSQGHYGNFMGILL